jgi:cell division protein FtsI/penicillin-binding protein 2
MAAQGKKQYKLGSRCQIKQLPSPKHAQWRIFVLFLLIFLVASSIAVKLYLLQVVAYESYKSLADDQHSLFSKLIPKRGEIFLKDKNDLYPAAVNKDTKMAYAVPKEVEDPVGTAETVSQMLSLDRDNVFERIKNPESMYSVLKHRLSDEEIDQINNSKLKGIHLTEEAYRYYPAGELASHVLGFVGWKGNEFGGRYGEESYYEDKLKGQEGRLFQNKDNSGGWITTGSKEISYAKNGDGLVLSIDHIIQYQTEKILAAAIEKHQADRGTIIVMEPSTGNILAMANYPNFNPNDYASVDNMEAFRNLAVSDPYESGSVFKTFTLAAALDSGRISPDTTYTDTGAVSEAGYTIRNSDLKANGVQTMTNVLEKSLNTGVIFAEKLMGNKNFADYVKRFGFGETTGVDIIGEAAGNIRNLENLKSNIQFFTASFGQGITVTPLQLAAGYNAIANGGVLMKPHLVDKIIKDDGTEEEVQPEEVRRVISREADAQISQILCSVVVNGHGKQAGVPGYLVAGKTGTAQVAGQGGYQEGMNIGTFAGFAPADNPRFTVVVRMDNPKDVAWAESSAAPTFGELMKFLLDYANVEPTEKYTDQDLEKFNATHTLKDFFIKKDEDKNNPSNDNNADLGNKPVGNLVVSTEADNKKKKK